MKIKWDDYVSNEQVLSRANIDDIEILLAKSRLRWLGHVGRMEDVRAAKMILFGELEHGLRSVVVFFFFIVFPNESVVIYFMLLYARLSS